MGILFGLAGAICFGIADFVARFASWRIGTYRTLFFMQFIGFFGLSLYLAITGEFGRLTESIYLAAWLWAGGAALLNVVSYLALYRAFEVGVLAVVSPIASSYAAVTVILSVMSGEVLSQKHVFGIGAVLIGLILAATAFVRTKDKELVKALSSHRCKQILPTGVLWAGFASLGFGVVFWILGVYVTPALGGIAPVWLFRIVTLVLLVPLSSITYQRLYLPQGDVWWLIVGIGLLDTAAFIAAMLGYGWGQISVVAVLVSL